MHIKPTVWKVETKLLVAIIMVAKIRIILKYLKKNCITIPAGDLLLFI